MNPMLQTVGLDYTQTLYRLVRFMGEPIRVDGWDYRHERDLLEAFGTLRAGQPIHDFERGNESVIFLVGCGGFMVSEAEFIEGETIGDDVLRIAQWRSNLMVSIDRED